MRVSGWVGFLGGGGEWEEEEGGLTRNRFLVRRLSGLLGMRVGVRF